MNWEQRYNELADVASLLARQRDDALARIAELKTQELLGKGKPSALHNGSAILDSHCIACSKESPKGNGALKKHSPHQ